MCIRDSVLKLRLGCLELVRRQTPSTSEGGRARSLYMMAHRMLNRRRRRTGVQQRRKILLQDGEEGGGTRRRSNRRDAFKSRRNYGTCRRQRRTTVNQSPVS